MLIVAGTIDVPPERRAEFLSVRGETTRHTLTEAGCIDFSFSADGIDEGRVRLFEIWESRADLQNHQNASPAAGRPGADIPVLARDIKHYEIASVQPSGSANAKQ